MADGRHTFDAVYDLVLRNPGDHPFVVGSSIDRLALGDMVGGSDVVVMNPVPDLPDRLPAGGIVWHDAALSKDALAGEYAPEHWRGHAAHYRIVARPDQFADVMIAYAVERRPGWWAHMLGRKPDQEPLDVHHEEIQLGVVLRAHCALGVKVQHGEVRSLCGS